MNKILIAHEKHGNRYFDASTEELRNAAALKLLTERFDEGYWYYKPNPPDDTLILSAEQIVQLPTEVLRNQEAAKLRQYKRDFAEYEKEVEDHQLIQKAVQTKDAALAYKLLKRRIDYEYENITVEKLEQI